MSNDPGLRRPEFAELAPDRVIADSHPESVWHWNWRCGKLTVVPNAIALPAKSDWYVPRAPGEHSTTSC